MKTDKIFYGIFKELPSVFFELIGNFETNADIYEFQSPEIKESSFRLDGVFSPQPDDPNYPLYFVEVQFYRDREFYNRLFSSIFLYFSQYQPPNPEWYAIVIYPNRNTEIVSHPRYRSLIESHLRCLYLDELSTELTSPSLSLAIVKLIIEDQTTVANSAKILISQAETELEDITVRSKFINLIETIVIYKFPKLSSEAITKMLDLDIIKHTRFYQEAHQEGLEQGKKEAKLEFIPKLIEKGMNLQEIADFLDLDIKTVRDFVDSK